MESGSSKHKAGFVSIIGLPNAGKSTLTNRLVGEKLSVITSKAQTTRHRIPGIVNGENFQIVFSDTPGILQPGYKLQEGMMKNVASALEDSDVIIILADPFSKEDENNQLYNKISGIKTPVVLLINKKDVASEDKINACCDFWNDKLKTEYSYVISAKTGFGMIDLLPTLVNLMPENPPYFPEDELTDLPVRFFISEIIREKIMMNYDKEIPYCAEVKVESYKEEEHITRISATIFVARDSQKGIIIGHKGSKLKKVGTEARLDMETFLETKVFLELFVRVKKNWRDDERQLKWFGY